MINYFSAQLQTKDTRIRLVSFDTKKHSKLASMAATRQPVSITQYKKQKNRINSIEEIVLENKTNINIIPRKLDFEFEEEPSTEIQHIVQDCPPHSLVSFVGVVSELSIEMETTTQLIFKEAIVRDGSAAIRVVFWGSSAHNIAQGYSYSFTDFRVKINDGVKYLNTPNNEDFDISEIADIENVSDVSMSLPTYPQMYVSIIAVIDYRLIYKCRVCGGAMKDHPEGRKLVGICTSCTAGARYNVCIEQVTLKMQMCNEDNKEIRLSFSSKSAKQIIAMAQKVLKDQDVKLSLACYENLFNITFNPRDNMVYAVST